MSHDICDDFLGRASEFSDGTLEPGALGDLRGLSYFHAFSWRTMEYARQMFLKAIELDAGFGRAWAGLAYAAGYIYLYRQKDEKYRQEALDASARALACCDTAEGRTARGVALWLSREYEAAESDSARRSISIPTSTRSSGCTGGWLTSAATTRKPPRSGSGPRP